MWVALGFAIAIFVLLIVWWFMRRRSYRAKFSKTGEPVVILGQPMGSSSNNDNNDNNDNNVNYGDMEPVVQLNAIPEAHEDVHAQPVLNLGAVDINRYNRDVNNMEPVIRLEQPLPPMVPGGPMQDIAPQGGSWLTRMYNGNNNDQNPSL